MILSIIKEIIEEGYIKYIIVKGDEIINSYIEFLEIRVSEKFRMRGIGTKLIERLVEVAKREGITSILVRTSTNGEDVFGRFLKANNFHLAVTEGGSIFKVCEKNFDGWELKADGGKKYKTYKYKDV